MHTEESNERIMNAEIALRNKLEFQFEVMKYLGFLPANFNPQNPNEALAENSVWDLWISGEVGESNTDIFSDEYQKLVSNSETRARFETDRAGLIAEIAAKLRTKKSFLN